MYLKDLALLKYGDFCVKLELLLLVVICVFFAFCYKILFELKSVEARRQVEIPA